MPRYNPLLDRLRTYPAVAVDERKAALLAAGKRVYDFGKGDPEEPPPAFVADALRAAVRPRFPYPVVRGQPAIREAIVGYLSRRFGVSLDPQTQILPTSGSKEAVFHMPLLVVDPGAEDRTVVFPDPGYPAYQRGTLFAGGEAHAVQLSGDHVLRPKDLPAEVVAKTRLIWLNHPHNPSGAVTPLVDLAEAADFCRAHDILLASDETYTDVYRADPPHSVLECGSDGVVALFSLSKRSGMTGYRSGFLAGDAAIIERLAQLRTNPGLVPSDFVNQAAAAAWSDDAHTEERRRIFWAKKKLFLDFFDELGLAVLGREATLYLWVAVPGGDDEAYATLLLDAGIVVSPGRIFGVSGGGQGYIRLAMVPSISECAAAISAWRTVTRSSNG
jgi:succinyldiaminopimelate transaminase